jgi:hypothetical protein
MDDFGGILWIFWRLEARIPNLGQPVRETIYILLIRLPLPLPRLLLLSRRNVLTLNTWTAMLRASPQIRHLQIMTCSIAGNHKVVP